MAGIAEIAPGQADGPRTVLLLQAQTDFGRSAPVIVLRRELVIGLDHALHRGESLGFLGVPRGDVDDAAHRIADIARALRAIDDIELLDLAGTDDAPLGTKAEAVAKEVGNGEPIDHHQRSRALRGMGAAKAGHAIAIA